MASPDPLQRGAQARADELENLAGAINLNVVVREVFTLARRVPATFIGKGKVEDLARTAEAQNIELVIFDVALSPVQQRNLEKHLKCKVIDRTALILDIFGARAQTREGILQVELAHLTYQKSRLVRSWTHLERQRGGFGFLGGPGETQIETDRRLIQARITKLLGELEHVKKTRALHRQQRQRVPYPVVALVGYTNAGKSTLFNTLTAAAVVAKDMLFATLDPTLRQVVLPGGMVVMLSDTVGFISQLPTQLIAAFRATLEEVEAADMILHVRDMAHPDSASQAQDVRATLTALDMNSEDRERVVDVWNKIDVLEPEQKHHLAVQAQAHKGVACFPVSARTGEGCSTLLAALAHHLSRDQTVMRVLLPAADGAGLHWLYTHGHVVEREADDEIIALTVRLPARYAAQAARQFNIKPV